MYRGSWNTSKKVGTADRPSPGEKVKKSWLVCTVKHAVMKINPKLTLSEKKKKTSKEDLSGKISKNIEQ